MDVAITVLVPVHDAALHLAETLASLRAQTFTDWSCICVDDGSTDASAAILAEIAAADPRFRVLSRPHGGVSAARNALLDAAGGEWIFFLDADDVLVHDCLGTLIECVRAHDVELGWAQYDRFSDSPPVLSPQGESRLMEGSGWRKLLARSFSLSRPAAASGVFGNVPCQPWNKLVRRRLLDGLRFDESLSRGEDLVFFAEVFRRVDRVAVSSRTTYLYRDSPGTLFRTAGGYAGFHAYVDAVCRFAESDRPPYMGGYLARRWVLSWLKGVWRWAGLKGDTAACRQFADDCRRLRAAFADRMPLASRLALALAPRWLRKA